MDFLTEYVKPLSKIADASILVPLVFLLLRRRYIKGNMRLLAGFVLLTFSRNLITEILSLSRTPNIIYYNWVAILLYFIIAYVYFTRLKGPVRTYFIPLSCIGLLGLSMLDYPTLLDGRTTVFNAYAYPVAGIFTIVLVLTFFAQLLESLQVPNLMRYPLFWFSSGALLYYTGTLLMYLFSRVTLSITKTSQWQDQFWSIDCLLTILFNGFITISFWYVGKNHEQAPKVRSSVLS